MLRTSNKIECDPYWKHYCHVIQNQIRFTLQIHLYSKSISSQRHSNSMNYEIANKVAQSAENVVREITDKNILQRKGKKDGIKCLVGYLELIGDKSHVFMRLDAFKFHSLQISHRNFSINLKKIHAAIANGSSLLAIEIQEWWWLGQYRYRCNKLQK